MTMTRDRFLVRAFLAIFVVVDAVTLWPDGMRGWRLGGLILGAIAGVAATVSVGVTRSTLWWLSVFLMGGVSVVVEFHDPFGVRRDAGLALVVLLLAFQIAQMRSTPGRPRVGRGLGVQH